MRRSVNLRSAAPGLRRFRTTSTSIREGRGVNASRRPSSCARGRFPAASVTARPCLL